MGKILVWVGADVTPTTGHQRFSAGNTPGDALARMVWGWGANESQIIGFQGHGSPKVSHTSMRKESELCRVYIM